MSTIELDTSNPATFENYISIKTRRNERRFFIALGIITLLYITYTIHIDNQRASYQNPEKEL